MEVVRKVDKITVTPIGAGYLQQNFNTGTQLPSLNRQTSDLQPQKSQNKSMQKQPSKGKLDVAQLRSILKDQTLNEINKLKQQTNNRAYLYVKQELMRDIISNKQFLNTKADAMARKMLTEPSSGQYIQTEVSKGRNYLSKLQGEYEIQRQEDERLRLRLKEKVRAQL